MARTPAKMNIRMMKGRRMYKPKIEVMKRTMTRTPTLWTSSLRGSTKGGYKARQRYETTKK